MIEIDVLGLSLIIWTAMLAKTTQGKQQKWWTRYIDGGNWHPKHNARVIDEGHGATL